MNFLSMKYFSSVAKEMSFTRAAERLHITQQTLSTHIAAIERELGCRLLVRTTPLSLTDAGMVFLRYAKQFEKLYGAMNQEFADIRSEEKGVLRVGIAHTRGRAILPELIAEYHARYPKIEVRLIEDTNDVLQRRLLDGEADLLIAYFPDGMPGIETRPFYQEELALVVPARLLHQLYGEKTEQLIRQVEAEQNISLLSECPFLVGSQEDVAGQIGGRLIAEAFCSPKISAHSSNIETLLELCVRGVGACFCPEILVRKALTAEQLSMVRVLRFERTTRYSIQFGWLKQPYCWKAILNFIEVASAMLGEN